MTRFWLPPFPSTFTPPLKYCVACPCIDTLRPPRCNTLLFIPAPPPVTLRSQRKSTTVRYIDLMCSTSTSPFPTSLSLPPSLFTPHHRPLSSLVTFSNPGLSATISAACLLFVRSCPFLWNNAVPTPPPSPHRQETSCTAFRSPANNYNALSNKWYDTIIAQPNNTLPKLLTSSSAYPSEQP